MLLKFSPFAMSRDGSAFSASALSSFITAANSSLETLAMGGTLLREKFANRLDQSFDVVLPRFDVDF